MAAGLTRTLLLAVVILEQLSIEVHNLRRPFDRLTVYDYRNSHAGTAWLLFLLRVVVVPIS